MASERAETGGAYRVANVQQVERREFGPEKLDLDWRELEPVLGLDRMRVNLWYFEEPGDEIGYHAHETQEEFYFVLEGRFSVKIGHSGETDIEEVGPGAIWTADPDVGRGTRFLGNDGEEGVLLAVGTPDEDDPGLNPHVLPEKELTSETIR